MEAHIPESNKKRVVIVGGGFGGLKLAKELLKSDYQVVLLDKNNYHQFQPLFYQVATAGLEPSSISFPFRKVFQGKDNFHFRLTNVETIVPESNYLQSGIGRINYDYLVIATGAGNNFFGNSNIEKYALPMKSISEALNLRNAILTRFEEALSVEEKDREKYLHIIIAGGGPTGVEVAGTLAEMKRYILPKDYPEIDFSAMKITLIEGSSRVLSAMHEDSSVKAKKYLEELGVEVVLNSLVTDYDGDAVSLKNGENIPCKTFVWAAGIKGDIPLGFKSEDKGRGNRLLVNRFNQVDNLENIFAIGDVAIMHGDSAYPNGHPQMAQGAIQQGKLLAENLNRLAKGKEMKPFHYKNLGSMATIGRNKAVVELPKRHFAGFFAWLVWMLVHLRSILGVKNKWIVFLNWVWNYFTYNLSLRLIIRK